MLLESLLIQLKDSPEYLIHGLLIPSTPCNIKLLPCLSFFLINDNPILYYILLCFIATNKMLLQSLYFKIKINNC